MKLTLRVALTTTLVTLIVLTVAALGYSGHRIARFTAEDLRSQILDKNSEIVEAQVNSLLDVASRQGDLNLDLIRNRVIDTTTFHRLARLWISVLKTHPRLSRQSIAMEATGEWSFIRRVPEGGKLAVGELRPDPSTGRLEQRDYWPEDYPDRPFNVVPDANDQDPRVLPWYIQAAKARRQVWSGAYILRDLEGFGHIPGVSCCTPILADDGSLQGVLTTSFDVVALSDFLQTLEVGRTGFAFVVETLPNGRRRVLAHPDPKILTRPAKATDKEKATGKARLHELVPPEELSDSRVPAFLREVPKTVAPAIGRRTTRVHFEHDGVPYIGAYRSLPHADRPHWQICIVMPESDVMGRVYQGNREMLGVGLTVLIAATLIGLVVSARLARPLERIVRQTAKIGRFEVEARPVAHSSIVEIDRLACVVEDTKTSLRSFGKYVPTDLIRQMFATGREAAPGGDRRRITISFCDLADFTTLSERLSPETLLAQMGDYFGRFSADIAAEGGTVDKYIGDAIMALWGAPTPSDGHAVAACLAALRNQETMADLNRRWRADGRPELVARIGIMTGDVIVGNIGSPARLNYTAMGDAVNLASRLEGLGKFYGTRILIGEPTYLEAGDVVLARPVDRVSVKGKSEGMLIYELLALRDGAGPDLVELARLAGEALRHYRDREWEEALALFGEILRLRPSDGPATVLAGRCRDFLEIPPAPDWDGVHRMATK